MPELQASFKRLLLAALALIPLLAVPAAAPAQFGFAPGGGGAATYPGDFSLSFRPGAVAFAGETVTVEVTATIDEGFYIYSLIPPEGSGPVHTQITVESGGVLVPIEGEDWTEPTPVRKFDPGFEIDVLLHSGTVVFRREFRVVDDARNGPAQITAEVFHMICDDTSCLPPRRMRPTAELTIRGGSDAPAAEPEADEQPAEEAEPAEEDDPQPAPAAVAETEAAAPPPPAADGESRSFDAFESIAAAGFLGIAISSFILGLISLLTPCVFPMIPITISFFTKRTNDSPRRRIALASVYGGAIIVCFSALGLGLALLMRMMGLDESSAGFIGRLAANPWLNLLLAGLFVFFALSLFGAFELQLPASWTNKLQQRQGGRTDIVGAVIMAIVFVLVSFTCTGPIVGPLIVLAMAGSWTTPFIALTAYSVGFAIPFFLLGLMPGLISSLPKSGGWLNATKVTMGLIEIAAAFKFISNTDLVWGWGVFTREVVLAAWTAIALVTALYLFGMFKMTHDGKVDSIGPGRLCFGLLFATLTFYFGYGLMGGRLQADLDAFLPPPTGPAAMASLGGAAGSGASDSGGRLEFIRNDLDAAMAEARRTGKPVFVDFTGHTCSNCRLMANTIFPQPEVRSRLEQMVRVALYTDEPGEVGERWQQHQIQRYNTFSLPFYVIVSPDDQDLAAWGRGLTRNPAAFAEFLDYGLERAAALQVASGE